MCFLPFIVIWRLNIIWCGFCVVDLVCLFGCFFFFNNSSNCIGSLLIYKGQIYHYPSLLSSVVNQHLMTQTSNWFCFVCFYNNSVRCSAVVRGLDPKRRCMSWAFNKNYHLSAVWEGNLLLCRKLKLTFGSFFRAGLMHQ